MISVSETAFMKSVMPGLLAARAGTEIRHGLLQIFAVLPGEARLGAVAFESLLMAAGADDRVVGALRLCRHFGRRMRLLEIGPRLFRKILRQRHQIVTLERFRDRRHLFVLACAGLEVAQLEKQITELLAPDHRYRKRLLLRHAVLAMAGGADLRLLLESLRMRGEAGRRERESNPDRNSFHIWLPVIRSADPAMTRKGRGRFRSRPDKSSNGEAFSYSAVKAMMLLPRLELTCTLPPAATTTYCLPPTM